MKTIAIGIVKLTKHLLIIVYVRLVYFFRIHGLYQNSKLNQLLGMNE